MRKSVFEHSGWVARRNAIIRDVLGDDSARADYRAVADFDVGKHDDIIADPDVMPDGDAARVLLVGKASEHVLIQTVLYGWKIVVVVGDNQFDIGAKSTKITNCYLAPAFGDKIPVVV